MQCKCDCKLVGKDIIKNATLMKKAFENISHSYEKISQIIWEKSYSNRKNSIKYF